MTVGTSNGEHYEDEFDMLHQQIFGEGYDPKTDTYQAPEQKDTKLFFVRHGETEDNENDLVRRKDDTLTDKGRKQVESTARQLKSEGVDAIISSSLPRARESAHIIASKLGIVPQFDERLNTWDVGDIEGKPCKEGDPQMKKLVEKSPDEKAPGGESFNDFKDRAFSGIKDAINNNSDKKLAVLTHSKVEGAIKAWNATGQDNPSIDPKKVSQNPDPPGSVEPFTMKANSTIMQPSGFDERYQGMPSGLPQKAPGESFEGTPSLYHPSLRNAPAWPGEPSEGVTNMPYTYTDSPVYKNIPDYLKNKPPTDTEQFEDKGKYQLISDKLPGLLGPMMDLARQADRLPPERQKAFVEDLKRRIKEGQTQRQISEETGESLGKVQRTIRSEGLPTNPSRGAPIKQIGEFTPPEENINKLVKKLFKDIPEIPKAKEDKLLKSLREWYQNQ